MKDACTRDTPRWGRRCRGVARRAWLVGVVALGASLPASAQQNLDQFHYRWRNDDGSEITATFAASQDTKLTGLAKAAVKRLRLEVSNEGASGSGPTAYQLQVAETASCSSGASPTARTLALGYLHSCVRLASGQAQCWGYNSDGEIGDGTTTQRPTAVAVSGITDATQVTAGQYHSCAGFPSGPPKCWGANSLGQLGDGTTTRRLIPTAITGIANAQQVTAGAYHTCSRLSGTLRCSGYNNHGALGDGTTTDRTTTVPVSGMTDAAQASAGHYHTCALRATGGVQCWGFNERGAIGDGTTADRLTPFTVPGLSNTVAVSAGGYHTCVLSSAGTAQCWGRNVEGELGDGTTTDRWTPVAVSGLTGAVQLAAGGYHTCALLGSGSVSCWGDNGYGQLGDGTTTDRTAPVAVSGITNAVEVASGHWHTCAVLATGQIACWGVNWNGQLGDGTTTDRHTPVTWVPSSPPTMPYRPVPTDTSGHWQITDSPNFADGDPTTDNPGLTNESTTFVPGEIKDASDTTGSISLATNTFTELEFALRATANATGNGSYCFRLYDATNSKALDTYAAYGEAQLAATTAVKLSSFTAKAGDSSVLLEWETASELDNLGFHLYRSRSPGGPYERITASLIPGLGSSPIGARYGYGDAGLTNGETYYYKLEDVETTGQAELHGPVSATPVPGAVDPGEDADPGGGDASSGGSARVAHGDPASSSLRIVRRGADGVELELLTGGFYATPEADGSVRLEIPGFEVAGGPGTPAVPVARVFLEALAGRQVRIGSLEALDVVSFSSLPPAPAGAPELVVGRDGTVRAGSRPVRPARASRGFYPEQMARVLGTAFQGEVKKGLVELAPLRWQARSGQLVLARRLRVSLLFAGLEEGELPLGGSRGRAYAPRPGGRDSLARRSVVAQLVTHERGLYVVDFERLLPGRRRGFPTSRLRLTRRGQDVAFHVEPDPSLFAPGSALYFLSEGGALSAYANEAVYELSLGGTAGTPMPVVAAAPAGAALAHAVEHRAWELNRYYLPGLLEAPDIWLWDSLVSGTPRKDYPFRLSGLAVSPTPATLSVWLQGGSDLDGSPDHHVRVSVNGSFVAEASWDGKTTRRIEAALFPGILQEGENLLELENVADTGAATSLVYLDRFSVDYPRTLAAEAGRFEASFGFSGSATLGGLGAGSVVLDTTAAAARWVVGSPAGADGLGLRVEAGHRYLAVSPPALLRPEVRSPSPGDLLDTANQADYLLVAPRELLPAATPLLGLRERQGLRTRAVALEEVFDAFGHGERSPQAIRDFLAYAYHRWSAPSPRYVLLLGDATCDPKDYAGTGVKDRVPAFMFKSSYLWTVSDQDYGAVNGDDELPDLAVGRLPAASLEQAQVLVQKLVAYEEAGFDLSGPAVLVADDADAAGDFEADADALAAGVLGSRRTEKIYLSQLGADAARAGIVAAFDRGASLMSYVGHGGSMVWASENLLSTFDMGKLAAQAQQPVLFTMNCLNGYFVPPAFDALAEALVKADGKGAIAAFSPSGLSLNAAAHRYHEALLEQMLSGRHARLGDAILAAQSDYAAARAFPELLRIYNLLGDPAMPLR